MKYIINQDFDQINEDTRTILFTGNVDNIYILNEIETQIRKLFQTPADINEAYVKFSTLTTSVVVKKDDFYNFVYELIEKSILILFYD